MKKISRRTKRNVSLYGLIMVAMLVLAVGAATAEPVPIAVEDIKATGEVPLKLYVFECGISKVKDLSSFDPNAEKGTEWDVSNSCYLIQHPQGALFWDAGAPDSVADAVEGLEFFDGAIQWFVPKTLKSQLDEIGIDPATIDYLALSHLHPDHIGNISYFNNSPLLIQEAEYESLPGLGKAMESYGFDASWYAAVEAHQPVITLRGNSDVFGDGSVVLVSAPGHSPGHQVLFVDLPKTGPVILSGDLYDSQHARDNYVVPPLTPDKRQLVKSFVRIDDLVEQTGAQLWLNHDKKQNETIAHAPAFYE